MATTKKTASRRAPSSKRTRTPPADQAGRLSRTLSESAQQVWLAGVGALGRAQSEGGKMFDALVREGAGFERTARKLAGGSAGQVREVLESTVDQARGRATETWDRLEKVFEDRVQRALTNLGVPDRDEVAALRRRVEALSAELRRKEGGAGGSRPQVRKATPATPDPPRKAATGKAAPRKAGAKAAISKTARVRRSTIA